MAQGMVPMLSMLALVIASSSSSAKFSEIRLTGGSGPHEGNVEVLINQTTWKYICDDGWDARDAKVVCRELGYAKTVEATKKTTFTLRNDSVVEDSNTTFWSSELLCRGDEQTLRNCENGTQDFSSCTINSSIAGVICSNITEKIQTEPEPSKASGVLEKPLELRIIGKSHHGFISSGFLEVRYDGVWGSVCGDGWTNMESYVACGNLGYPDTELNDLTYNGSEDLVKKEVYHSTHYWMNNVKCTGKESTLSECNHFGWKRHICRTDKPVYLRCKRSPLLRDNRFDRALISNHDVRLRSGYRHSEGRVEVRYKGEWGSICDDNWSLQNANVFCRQVGFGTAFAAIHEASFGQGSGGVWLDEVKCLGNEESILHCRHSGLNKTDCGHKEDAGVKCHYPYGVPATKVRLEGSYNPLQGKVEVFSDGRWRGICGIGWGIREAGVVCRQLGLGYPRKAMSTLRFGYASEFAMYRVKCSGDELSITHCHHDGPTYQLCRYYEVAAVRCTPNAADLVMDVEELRQSIHLEEKPLQKLTCAFDEQCLASDAKAQMDYPDLFSRMLLRFTARFWNRGTASFRPHAKKRLWQWHVCHQHFHSMERFADYDITDSNGNKVAEGHKASFCLEDYECEKGTTPKFKCNRKANQGLQVNCADTYKHHLDCQWVDVTKLGYGQYTLRVVLNPQNKVYETDYSNNIASCELNYSGWKRITVGKCRIDPCEKMSWGGVGDGACCKFPFVYKGKQYHSCTHDGPKGYLWCATTSNYDKDGLWGRC